MRPFLLQSLVWRMIWGSWKWAGFPAMTSMLNVSLAANKNTLLSSVERKPISCSTRLTHTDTHTEASTGKAADYDVVKKHKLKKMGLNLKHLSFLSKLCQFAEVRLLVVPVQVSTRGWSLGALWSSSRTTSTWTIETCTLTVCTLAS